MQSKNLNNLGVKLKTAAKEKSLARRGVKIAAVIAEALRSVGQDSILVGGAAVEFYTEGGYATKDIDMIAAGGPDLWRVMEELGFQRRGKDFINEKLEIYIEFPGEMLGAGRISNVLDVDGMPLRIISVEDLIVDRLCAYKFWKSGMDGLSALLLLESGRCDRGRLKKQAKKEAVLDALDYVEKLYEQVVRRKLSKKRASQLMQQWLQKN